MKRNDIAIEIELLESVIGCSGRYDDCMSSCCVVEFDNGDIVHYDPSAEPTSTYNFWEYKSWTTGFIDHFGTFAELMDFLRDKFGARDV